MADTVQYVYLDFDGARTTYRNQDLRISLSVTVYDPGFSEEQEQDILSGLNAKYASDNVVFTTDKPKDVSYSTLYFGQSESFDKYGDFFGVAETRDDQNRRSDDNAFVLLDSAYSTDQVISVSAQVLDHILGNSYLVDGMDSLRDYASNACMLSTSWSQRNPYNKYCPIDPVTGERSVAGCTNIAAAQVIYYWIETGLLDLSLTVENTDAYTENGITIDSSSANASIYGYLSFSETNKLLSSFQVGSTDCIAALCFAAGIVQQAAYSSTSTSTPYIRSLLTRSGFANGITEYYDNGRGSMYYYSNFGGLTENGYVVLIRELLDGRPVLASVYYGNGKNEGEEEHAVVIDGYDSSTDTFHLNFGWGGLRNGWYTRDELNNDLGIYDMFTGVTPNMAPRLAVQKFTSKADAVNRDGTVTLYFSVANQGKTKSNEVKATFYCGRKQLGSVSVDSVSAGGASTLSLTFNASLLSLGSNTITVRANSAGVSRILSASQTVKVYDGAVTDADNSWKAVSTVDKWKFSAQYDPEGIAAELVLAKDEYVGYCDTVDCRELTLEHPGKYTFTLSGVTNDLELSIYALDGDGKLKLRKSAVVRASSNGGKISGAPLEAGTHYISVRAVNAETHGDSDYKLTFSGIGYLKADNSDDWTDLKESGVDGAVRDAGLIDGETADIITEEWVGLGDEFDYRLFLIPSPAKVSFTVTATDAVKFTIYELTEKTDKKGVVTYSLKSLQSTKIKAGKPVDTKGLLLSAGNAPGKYCFSVQSTNAAKGGSADYTVSFNQSESVFYTGGDNSDDWGDLKEQGGEGAVRDAGELSSGTEVVVADEWVGFGDAVDYRSFSLGSAAKLVFSLEAADAAKFTILQIKEKTDKKGITTYSLKSLQATSLAKDKKTGVYAATTKSLLLDEGTYYFSMQSTNAAKGGSADYGVTLDGASSVFLTDIDGGTNDWLYEKKLGLNTVLRDSAATVLVSGMTSVQIDADKTGLDGWDNFVGYNDPADYLKIRLDADAVLSFTATATDASKFVICSFTETTDKKGNPKYTLKALQTTKLSKQKNATEYSATTKPLELAAGEYYISMLSTNAKKGGSAYYNIELNQDACSGLPEEAELPDAQQACALDVQDDLSFGEYTHTFADSSAPVLAGSFDSSMQIRQETAFLA